MEERPESPPLRGLFAWRTRDILMVAVIGVCFSLILTGANYATILTAVFGAVVDWAWIGVWVLGPLFIAYVVRRPGAALLVALMSELIMLPFAGIGLFGLYRGIVYGLAVELGVFLFTRYRSFNMIKLMLAGTFTSIVIFFFASFMFPLFNTELLLLAGMTLSLVLSCSFAGAIAKLLADSLARTGVLSGMMDQTQIKEV